MDNLIKEHLLRRLRVNYIAYSGQPKTNIDWLDGYDQAIRDCAAFIKQMQIFSSEE
jgi:hypothetical protein